MFRRGGQASRRRQNSEQASQGAHEDSSIHGNGLPPNPGACNFPASAAAVKYELGRLEAGGHGDEFVPDFSGSVYTCGWNLSPAVLSSVESLGRCLATSQQARGADENMRKLLLRNAAAFLAVLGLSCVAFSQTKAMVGSSGPESVFVGMYINDLYDLDLKKSTYVADFYVWMRWRGVLDPSNVEFLNGGLDLKEHPDTREASGVRYISFHCRGTFHAVFDYRRYPLDEQHLVIEMEDGNYESEQLRYIVDRDNLSHLTAPAISGWICGLPQFEVRDNTYETNFGDPTETTGGITAYSRLYCSIRIGRHSFSIYIKTFLALFISMAIAFLSFVLKPSETDPRFGVGLAAIFGAVSSEIVVASNLPDMPYLTLADKIHLFSLFVIFLTLLQSCLSLRLFRQGKLAVATRIDRISLFAFPICYALIVSRLTFAH